MFKGERLHRMLDFIESLRSVRLDVAREFTEDDWYHWPGASQLPDGTGPFISSGNGRYSVVFSGLTYGYPGKDGDGWDDPDCVMTVSYFTGGDPVDGEPVCWSRELPDYMGNRDVHFCFFNTACHMLNDGSMPEGDVDRFLSESRFKRVS